MNKYTYTDILRASYENIDKTRMVVKEVIKPKHDSYIISINNLINLIFVIQYYHKCTLVPLIH